MLNWIGCIRTVYTYKNGFGIKSPTMVDVPSNQTKQNLIIEKNMKTLNCLGRKEGGLKL